MRDFIERLSPKIKKVAKKMLWVLAGLITFSVVISDLGSPDGGYLQLIFTWALSTLIAAYSHAIEIASTPLADLTISKIIGLIFYVVVAIILFVVGRVILSWVFEKLGESGDSD